MLSVAEARSQVLSRCQPLPPEKMTHSAALGRVLAESVASDLDMPPFDKALMDGYAVRGADVASPPATLEVIEEITAGMTPARAVGPGQASRIMTGAPIPEGADTVVVVEQTRMLDDGRVRIDGPVVKPGANVLKRGREMRQGEMVLCAGTVLRPQEIGVLATLGRAEALVTPPPRLSVIATGDELVEPPIVPGPGQIRNSNAPMLVAQATRAGATARSLGIARDRVESLRPLIHEGLDTSDVVILSGGVSAGKLDLVPGVLRELGVEPHFHKVRLKPGKPLFFGTCGRKLVFGLPGNPVSSFVCFELFIRPAVRRLAGRADLDLPAVRATLAADFAYSTDRPTYHPARLDLGASEWRVAPVPWFGSADLRAFLAATGLLVLPAGDNALRAGQGVVVLRLDG
jgi:molybdopterin molybdotransferase